MVEKNRGDAALLELSDQEIADALGMVHILQDRPIPTLAGLLLVGKESALRRYVPAHEVAFQVLRGTDVAVNEFRHWPLLRIHEWLMQAIEVRNEEQELMSGGIRVGIARYDPRGIREAVNNALLHRDYGMLGAVHVQLHQDHVLIMNPGGFVMNVRPDNVLTTPPRPRNPLLADGFKRVGLVERTGRGVSIIFSGQLRSGRNPPSYALSTASSVTVIMDSRPADMAFVEQLIQGEKRLRRLLTVAELLILQEMWVVGEVSLTTSAGLIQRDKSFARQVLREMQRHRLIRIVNDTPDPVYSLGQSFAHASEQIEVGLDGEGYVLTELEAQVLSLACQQGQIQRQQVEALSGLSRDQAYRLLRHLVDKGVLELVGKGRGAHYQLTDRVQRGNVR
jgi:ATP-dependent DNA helicase RecG